MQEIVPDIGLTVLQSAVILSLILMVVSLIRPGWFLFWMKEPKPFYLFASTAILFMGSYFGFSLKTGNPWPIAAIHAVILFSILFLIVGLINPSWVFGTQLDRLWVMAIAAALFMGFMTLQGVYYGPKNKRLHSRPPETQSPHQLPTQAPAETQPATQPPTLSESPTNSEVPAE